MDYSFALDSIKRCKLQLNNKIKYLLSPRSIPTVKDTLKMGVTEWKTIETENNKNPLQPFLRSEVDFKSTLLRRENECIEKI